jgi:hypothetical protein
MILQLDRLRTNRSVQKRHHRSVALSLFVKRLELLMSRCVKRQKSLIKLLLEVFHLK